MGRDIEDGLVPNDEKIVGPMIRNICYANAKNYMAFPGVTDAAPAPKLAAKKRK
jgi:hypothetical protein